VSGMIGTIKVDRIVKLCVEQRKISDKFYENK
jgi:hypothetical protein